MNLNEQVLMDTAGNWHFQGVIAKPFQHYSTRADWLVVVGEADAQDQKVWFCSTPSLDVRLIAVSAIDWFIKQRDAAKQPLQVEVPNDGPKV